MNKQSVILHPMSVDGVFEPDIISGDGLQAVKLMHADGVLTAWTWEHIQVTPGSLLSGTAEIRPAGFPHDSVPIIERIRWEPAMQVVDVIPSTFARKNDTIPRFKRLVSRMFHPGLHQLLHDVFAIPALFQDFWSAAYDEADSIGEVAEAAIATAERVEGSPYLFSFGRNVGIVFALLREAGRAWPRQWWQDHCPALHCLAQIQGAIETLSQEYPEEAATLTELMQYQWRLSFEPDTTFILEHVLTLAHACRGHRGEAGIVLDDSPVPDNVIPLDWARVRRQQILDA
jgi:hypothetical protein